MKCYIIDAFTDTVFQGNPAAICVLNQWLSDDCMQLIAMENNLSETAFLVKKNEAYELRWFTPGGEIDLCGHATLASAFVIMNYIEECDVVTFETTSGTLIVHKNGDIYEMDMPAYDLKQVAVTKEMTEAIGYQPLEAWIGRDLVCVLENEEQVKSSMPQSADLLKLDGLLLHITAKGSDYDCVTRSFAPKLNVYEDPVCGSGHCHVIPLWAKHLHKTQLIAYQASKRSGVLYCTMNGDRVILGGKAVLYAVSEVNVF